MTKDFLIPAQLLKRKQVYILITSFSLVLVISLKRNFRSQMLSFFYKSAEDFEVNQSISYFQSLVSDQQEIFYFRDLRNVSFQDIYKLF